MKRFIISTFFIALVVMFAAVLMVNQAQAGSPGSPPLFAPTPTPKGRGPTGPTRINTTFTTINGNPLKVLVATDGSAQVQYNYVPPVSPNGQFYPASSNMADMGIFLWVGSNAFGPNVGARTSAYGNPPIPFTELSQTPVTGSGTNVDPFVITTRLGVSNTLTVAQKLTYINGQQFYRMDTTINNSTQGQLNLTYFHAGDIYLKGSDNGFPYYDPTTGAIGGKSQTQDWFVLFQPNSPPASKYKEAFYGTIWDDIGQGGAQGPGFNNTTDPAYIDNGAGLQWSNVLVPPSGATTISDYVTFGAQPVQPTPPAGTPVPTPIPGPPPAQVPEGDTLVLVGTGLLGLAGYAGLLWRTRRAK